MHPFIEVVSVEHHFKGHDVSILGSGEVEAFFDFLIVVRIRSFRYSQNFFPLVL